MAKQKGGKRALAPEIERQAEALVKPVLEQFQCELWDVCFEKEGAMWYLRVLFDKEGGVDSDKCEEISQPINELFDKQKFIEQVDILEIGTPGLSKRLRKPEHFRSCIGTKVIAQVKTRQGEKYLQGVLQGYDGENGEITLEGGETVKISKCVKINADIDA